MLTHTGAHALWAHSRVVSQDVVCSVSGCSVGVQWNCCLLLWLAVGACVLRFGCWYNVALSKKWVGCIFWKKFSYFHAVAWPVVQLVELEENFEQWWTTYEKQIVFFRTTSSFIFGDIYLIGWGNLKVKMSSTSLTDSENAYATYLYYLFLFVCPCNISSWKN
jgi:hypothetical protein